MRLKILIGGMSGLALALSGCGGGGAAQDGPAQVRSSEALTSEPDGGPADGDPAQPARAPMIWADQADYAPADTAVLNGEYFHPNEEVTVQVEHLDPTVVDGHGHAPFVVTTDDQGAFTTSWYVDPDDSLGQLFRASADCSHGLHAETLFTDRNTTDYVLTAVDTGAYTASGAHAASNKNFMAGDSYQSGYRDYFVFDLAPVVGNAIAVKLVVQSACSAGGSGTFTLRDVTTAIATLEATQSGATGIYADLGSGTTFGAATLSPGANSYSVDFSSAGVKAFPNSGLFALGGQFTGSGYLLGCTAAPTQAQLVVTVSGLKDTTPPVVTVPADSTAEATGPAGRAVTFTATAVDETDGALTPTCAPASGSTFALGSTTVTCTAKDAAGNIGSASFHVTVVDTTAPVIASTADLYVEATSASGAIASYSAPAANDLVDGAVSVACAPISGALFAIGPHTVTCSATDAHGNTATTAFVITVRDTIAPSFTAAPAALTLEATGPLGAPAIFATPTATDAVGVASVTCVPASGSTFAIGTSDVRCTALDASGNPASIGFAVTVVDTTPPAISGVPAPIPAEASSSAGALVTWTTPSATDLVDGAVSVSCNPAAGSTFALGVSTVSCSASDAHGNIAHASFTVTVVDTTPPAISAVPADFTVEATGPQGAVASYTAPSATDLVDGAVDVTCDPASGSTFALGPTVVTCLATDAHQNQARATFTVTVADTTPPVVSVPADISVIANSATGDVITFASAASDLVSGSLSDDCSPPSGTDFPPGTTVVTCSATDGAGNTGTAQFQVRVLFGWSGLLQPINGNGSSVFKLGRTVPVKFALTDASAPIANLSAHLKVGKASDGITGTVTEAVATASADVGNTFRYDPTAHQYVFNLSTSGWSQGTWVLRVDLGDGVPHDTLISLRP